MRLAERALAPAPATGRDEPELRAVAAARELVQSGPYWRRVEVEARLLADEPVATIAAKSGIPVPVVEAYEALFYAVADRLQATAYIMHVVVGLYAPGADRDAGVQVRMYGYRGGPHVVDAMLEAMAGPRPGVTGTEATRDPEVARLARIAVGLRTTPVTEKNFMRWARLHFLIRQCQACGV